MFIGRGLSKFLIAGAGTILVFWAIAMAVFFGLTALSFDIGRISSTQSELQSFADNVALAAAGELDGADDAITRAEAAAANLISDTHTYGSSDRTLSGVTDYTLTFHATLPANDQDAIAGFTTDPAEAIFARVVVNPETIELTFAAVFATLTGNAQPDSTVGAVAVAGFTRYACDITPMMFCLPDPGYRAENHVGEMILLRSGGSGSAWGPGDFGFLDVSSAGIDDEGPCAGSNGANLIMCLLAAEDNLTRCFAQRGVDTEPGQKVGLNAAMFNVRFDIYEGTMTGKKNNSDFRPAPNVIKGIVPGGGGSCIQGNADPSPDTVELPTDDCFAAGTCGRFGDGDWSSGRANYVNINYGGTDPHPSASTRWEYYNAELAAAGGAGSSDPILPAGLSETGRPQCSSNMSDNPRRRVLIAAGVDCAANPISGAETGVPVEQFAELFLTEPVGSDGGSPPVFDMWVEVIGSAEGDGGASEAIFHDVVQLYR